MDENGETRANLLIATSPQLSFSDKNGKVRLQLNLNPPTGGPALVFADENGKMRAILESTFVNPTGTKILGKLLPVEKSLRTTLIIFDKDEKVIWSAP